MRQTLQPFRNFAIRRNQVLIEMHRRRLHVLKLQKAKYGINSPPHIVIEIEDIEKEIDKLEVKIRDISAETSYFAGLKDSSYLLLLSICSFALLTSLGILASPLRAQLFISDSDVRIVDISLNDGHVTIVNDDMKSESLYPELEIKLRNVGDKVAFLKRAIFNVEEVKILDLKKGCELGAVGASSNYNVDFPIRETPYIIMQNISQEIKPDSVDRFVFYLQTHLDNNKEYQYQTFRVFRVNIRIEFNEEGMASFDRDLVFVSPTLNGSCTFLRKDNSELDTLSDNDRLYFTSLQSDKLVLSPIARNLVRAAKENCQFNMRGLVCKGVVGSWVDP